MLYVHLRAWRYPARLRSVIAPMEVRAAVLPATRPCSGRRLPPVVRLRPHRRPRFSPGHPGGLRVVFRRDSKVDAFQRQISALRHQLGCENDGETVTDLDRPLSFLSRDTPYLSDYPDFPSMVLNVPLPLAGSPIPRSRDCWPQLLHRSQQSTCRPVSSLIQRRGGATRIERFSAHPWAGGRFADCTGHDFRRGGGGR